MQTSLWQIEFDAHKDSRYNAETIRKHGSNGREEILASPVKLTVRRPTECLCLRQECVLTTTGELDHCGDHKFEHLEVNS